MVGSSTWRMKHSCLGAQRNHQICGHAGCMCSQVCNLIDHLSQGRGRRDPRGSGGVLQAEAVYQPLELLSRGDPFPSKTLLEAASSSYISIYQYISRYFITISGQGACTFQSVEWQSGGRKALEESHGSRIFPRNILSQLSPWASFWSPQNVSNSNENQCPQGSF